MAKLIFTLVFLLISTTPHYSYSNNIEEKYNQREYEIDQTQLNCLTKAIYIESRGEHLVGRTAVGLVIMNRVYSGRYPDTVCGVIYDKCQFQWACKRHKISNDSGWDESELIATRILRGEIFDITNGATHFHSNRVNPNWELRRVAVIGNHIFYRK